MKLQLKIVVVLSVCALSGAVDFASQRHSPAESRAPVEGQPPPAAIFATSFVGCDDWSTATAGPPTGCQTAAGSPSQIVSHGRWTACEGLADEIIVAANNPEGGGGKGLRHWRCDGANSNGGGIQVRLPEKPTKVWLRFYMRYQEGFKWTRLHYTKEIYWNVFRRGEIVVLGFSYWKLYTHVQANGRASNVTSSDTWDKINKGSSADGKFHCYEQFLQTDTNGHDGKLEMWRDGERVLSRSDINFKGADFSHFLIGSNQNRPGNDGPRYTDYDDFVVSTTGQIGCKAAA